MQRYIRIVNVTVVTESGREQTFQPGQLVHVRTDRTNGVGQAHCVSRELAESMVADGNARWHDPANDTPPTADPAGGDAAADTDEDGWMDDDPADDAGLDDDDVAPPAA